MNMNMILDTDIVHDLKQFCEHGSPAGYYLLRGRFPLDETLLPETPQSSDFFVGGKTPLAHFQAAVNDCLGTMIAYEAEGNGQLFQDMVPCRALADTQTSVSSSVELELHTEQAFSPCRPDFLSLACLRGNPCAKTYVLSLEKALPHFTEQELDLLRQPLWMVGVDLSFRAEIGGAERGPIPIVSDSSNSLCWVFDQDLMRGLTEEARELHRRVVEIYVAHRDTLVLQPGDVCIIDNRRALHGRSSFMPTYDGKDRFIIRSFVVTDISRVEHACRNGVVQASFS